MGYIYKNKIDLKDQILFFHYIMAKNSNINFNIELFIN